MEPSKLDYALAWAARGFKVFPLQEGSKLPYGGGSWLDIATDDPGSIRELWTRRPRANIGVSTTGFIVVDVDVKNGKQGEANLLLSGLPLDTLTVRTPSGGYHLYYDALGERRTSGVDVLGDGLDVRAHHGYVIAPGSTLPAGGYTEEGSYPVKAAPATLLAALGRPKDRDATQDPAVELDAPEALAWAAKLLDDERQERPPAEGERNDKLFRLAAMVKDEGVSEDAAVRLLSEHWNLPPHDLPEGEVLKTIRSAYANGLSRPGVASPAHHFAGVNLASFDAPSGKTKAETAATGLRALLEPRPFTDPAKIPKRPWLASGLFLRGYVTALIAPGAAGKSTFQLTCAVHYAMGRSFAGFDLAAPGKPLRSIVINLEDDRSEMERRVLAICIDYGFNPAEVAKRVVLLPGAEHGFKVGDGSHPMKVRTEELRTLAETCVRDDVSVVFVDPLIETHDIDVNDNQGLKQVMAYFRALARQANVALCLAHHTSKSSKDRAGDVDASMGAGAIANSSRIAFTMFPASEDHVKAFSLPKGAARSFVRLDSAKASYGPGSDAPVWLRKASVDLPNGDSTVVLRVVDTKATRKADAENVAEAIHAVFTETHIVSATVHETAKFLIARDPLLSQENERSYGRKLKTMLAAGVALEGGGTIRFVVEKSTQTAPARDVIVLVD